MVHRTLRNRTIILSPVENTSNGPMTRARRAFLHLEDLEDLDMVSTYGGNRPRKKARISDLSDRTAVEEDAGTDFEGDNTMLDFDVDVIEATTHTTLKRKGGKSGRANRRGPMSGRSKVAKEIDSEDTLAVHETAQDRMNRSIDLWCCVFDWLGSDKVALSACVRVCKAWKSPAGSVLWRYLPSPLPLLKLLTPPDVDDISGLTCFRSFGTEANWTSYKQYSLFVHGMEWWQGFSNDVTSVPTISHIISLGRVVGFSFIPPNLRDFGCEFIGDEACVWLVDALQQYIQDCASSTSNLKTLKLDAKKIDQHTLKAIIFRIRQLSGLQHLELKSVLTGSEDANPMTISLIAHELMGFKNLKVVVLDAYTLLQPEIWTSLSSLPYLKELRTCHMYKEDEFVARALENGFDDEDITPRMFDFTHLEVLELKLPLRRIQYLFDDCSTSFPSLLRLSLSIIEPVQTRVMYDHIAPILTLSQLEELEIRTRTVVNLGDAEYGSLSRRLLNLRKLSIVPLLGSRTIYPKATLAALSHIADWNPNLEEVALCVQGSFPETFNLDIVREGFTNISSVRMSFSTTREWSSTKEKLYIAMYLAHLVDYNEKALIESGFAGEEKESLSLPDANALQKMLYNEANDSWAEIQALVRVFCLRIACKAGEKIDLPHLPLRPAHGESNAFGDNSSVFEEQDAEVEVDVTDEAELDPEIEDEEDTGQWETESLLVPLPLDGVSRAAGRPYPWMTQARLF